MPIDPHELNERLFGPDPSDTYVDPMRKLFLAAPAGPSLEDLIEVEFVSPDTEGQEELDRLGYHSELFNDDQPGC